MILNTTANTGDWRVSSSVNLNLSCFQQLEFYEFWFIWSIPFNNHYFFFPGAGSTTSSG